MKRHHSTRKHAQTDAWRGWVGAAGLVTALTSVSVHAQPGEGNIRERPAQLDPLTRQGFDRFEATRSASPTGDEPHREDAGPSTGRGATAAPTRLSEAPLRETGFVPNQALTCQPRKTARLEDTSVPRSALPRRPPSPKQKPKPAGVWTSRLLGCSRWDWPCCALAAGEPQRGARPEAAAYLPTGARPDAGGSRVRAYRVIARYFG